MAEFESLSKENYENFYWSSNLSHQRLWKKREKLIIVMKIIFAKKKHKNITENQLYYLITWYA